MNVRGMTAPNPDYERIVRDMFMGQPFMAHIGASLVTVSPGASEIHLPARAELTQHDGYFHGGVIATLCDMAGGSAAFSVLPIGKRALTVEFKVNIIAPGQGDLLISRGQVIRPGRSLIICRSDVMAVRDAKETHCATCLMTLMVLDR